jgi:PAS domain S-box-containing protein
MRMTQDKVATKEQLDRLKASFAEKLAARLGEIEETAEAFLAATAPEDATPLLETLRSLAHKLAGAAGTFGYPQVGENARALEQLCLPLLDGAPSPGPEGREKVLALLGKLRETGGLPRQETEEEFPQPRKADGRQPVLLVEDNLELARLLQYQLGNFGFNVHLLPSPLALETAVANLHPAAIVMDIIFGTDDKAGLSAISALRDKGLVTCPVIFLSVRDDFDARLEAVRNGGDAYLVKPPRIMDLVATLNQFVARAQIDPYRAMIVDDDPMMVEMLSINLGDAGILCEGVTDPRRMLETLFRFRPDVIVLDVHMPDVSGIELARMIRELGAPYFRIPIIFATSARSDASRLLTVRAGGDDLIPKPVDISLLTASVMARAERSRAVTTVTRQQAEQDEQCHAVSRLAADAVVSTDDNGIITFWNAAAERMFGFAADDILGWPFLKLVPAGDRDRVREELNRLGPSWRHGPNHGSLELSCLTRAGHAFPAEASLSGWRRDGARAFTLQIRDITERRRKDEALRAALADAEAASKAKTRFLSAMCREFRVSIDAILGSVRLLETDANNPLGERQSVRIDDIRRTGGRLLDMISEVLDLARIESGGLEFELGAADPRRLVGDCLAAIAARAEARNIVIENRLSGEPWPELRIDIRRARQVLLSLLSNAVTYNREGGRVWVEGQARESGSLRISVGDTGPGIPADLHDRLFLPFEGPTADGRAEGAGIGLALTRLLAEGMGGAVGFDTEEGKGSVFWVDFPFA